MYYKPYLGREVSALGMGVLRLPSVPGEPDRIDRAQAARVFDEAFACGINYFDTAYTYQKGDSERVVGELLSSRPRESYLLASKYYAAAGVDIRACFEEQLRRCRTEYFDVYLFHGLDEQYIGHYMDEKAGCLDFLLEQKRRGRIRSLGFSSHAAPATLARFLDWYGGFDMALLQLNYLDWTLLDGRTQYRLLHERNIPIWVMEPLKGGRLAQLNDEAAAILRAAAPDRSLASWGFRWLMGLEGVHTVLSGMASVEQVRDNAATFARHDPLSEGEQQALAQASAAFLRTLGVPCSACRYCCDTCPAGLDIPLLIRGYNERSVTGETWRVGGLSQAQGPEGCLHCGACLSHCPQKIDIPDVLARSAALRAK